MLVAEGHRLVRALTLALTQANAATGPASPQSDHDQLRQTSSREQGIGAAVKYLRHALLSLLCCCLSDARAELAVTHIV